MRFLITLLTTIVAIATTTAQTTKERIFMDQRLAGGIYRPYPTEFKAQTPVPKGYEAFYISHYGRHGSRFIEFNKEFDMILSTFENAAQQNMLTAFGKETYDKLLAAGKICQGRAGDLTPLGITQHEQIATRMFENHPSIFRKAPEVTAISTTVPRCLISMNAFTNQLIRLKPDINISLLDTGHPYMPILNPLSGVRTTPLAKRVDKYRWPHAEWVKEWDAFRDKHIDNSRMLNALFETEFVPMIEDVNLFSMYLFRNIASFGGTPASHIDFSEVFTKDEVYRWWRVINIRSYLERGNSGVGGGFLSEIADVLVYHFLTEAQQKVATGKPAVSLRFGHDGCIMCMLGSMGITGWAQRVDNWEEVEDVCCDFTIPMGCNFQWIFYRHKKSGEVLVKMMLNEEELELPLQSDVAPYYRWSDVEAYCKDCLADSTLYKFDLTK